MEDEDEDVRKEKYVREEEYAKAWELKLLAHVERQLHAVRVQVVLCQPHLRHEETRAKGRLSAVGLRCVQAGWASGVSITCFVEEACWSSMPSTTRMVSKDSITWAQHWVASLPTLQRRRWMDAAAHAWGSCSARA